MAGLEQNRGKSSVLRHVNLNSVQQPGLRERGQVGQLGQGGQMGGQGVLQLGSPLILDGRKCIEISDRNYNRSSPVSVGNQGLSQELNRVPVSNGGTILRGYSPGPQPGIAGHTTLPRNLTQQTVSQDFSNQTLPARYSQSMQQQYSTQLMNNRGMTGQKSGSQQQLNQIQSINQSFHLPPSSQHNIQSINQHFANQQASQQTTKHLQQQQSQQMFQQQQAIQQHQQQAALKQQQQQQQQAALQHQQSVLQQQQKQSSFQQQQQALQQQQQALQQLLQRQRSEEDSRKKREEAELQENMAALRLNKQGIETGGDQDRTYMNVQPVAIVGKGGRILKPGDVKENYLKQETGGGKKAPVIPKSQEVTYKKEPLYSTILQFPGPDTNPKLLGPNVFEDCVYANYAPASLYSNYSNYSELEVLRSTDSQCSNEDEPTEGLPNLGDSPVSSSYSELRQANILGVHPTVPMTQAADGSIYEPILPPKGIAGPNSLHFKTLSNGSTDSDYFGSCIACGGKIIGEGAGCSAMGRLYHVQCFTCTECGRLLQGLPFYAVEGAPLCEADYTNTLEQCCKCFQPILERILRATGTNSF